MKFTFLKKNNKNTYSNPIEYEQRLKKISKLVGHRFIILVVVLALLMVALIARLYQIQIIDYQTNLALAKEHKVITNTSLNPRGEIVDRNGHVLVTNRELLTITYSSPEHETRESMWEKAVNFVKLFDVETDHLIFRDLQDAYLTFYPKEGEELITNEENALYLANELSNNQIYQLQVSRVSESMVDRLTKEQIEIFSVYQRMAIIPGLVKVIKEDITAEEVALLLDNINEFGGFNISLDWRRQYASDNNLSGLLGALTTQKQGLLPDSLDYYLANDYNMKDTVGRAGIESQYEAVLSGDKSVYSVVYNDDGFAQINLLDSGNPGATLRTTIDLGFQNYMEETMIQYLKDREADANYRYFNKFYLVASDPKTGDILANVAIKIDKDGNYYNSANSTYLDSYPVGSAIKGAIIYMGHDKNLIRPGEIILDAPIKIQGTPEKSSYQTLGPVNDLQALAYSSNVYMFNIVIRLGKGNYQYNRPLYLTNDVVDHMRYYFSLFGLGNSTQLDVPNEGTGYKSNSALAGNLLDFAIGQYDTYTAMQLNQYVSTIANGQYRYALRFVSDAYNPQTKEVVFENNVNILNSIDNTTAIERVQTGFRMCVTEGYCTSFRDALWPTAAKTGTSEDIARDPFTDAVIRDQNNEIVEVSSNTLVAYAPYDDPKIAVSCIAPYYVADRIVENGCSFVTEEAINYFASNE